MWSGLDPCVSWGVLSIAEHHAQLSKTENRGSFGDWFCGLHDRHVVGRGPNLLLLSIFGRFYPNRNHDANHDRRSDLLPAGLVRNSACLDRDGTSVLPDGVHAAGLPAGVYPSVQSDSDPASSCQAAPAATVAPVPETTATAAAPATTPAEATTTTGDPYGFTGWLNATRAAYGLPAVGHDPNLSSWAAENNNQQAARGMGHFVMGPARRQNSAVGSISNIGSMWMNSPAHRAALLDPTIRWIGIAGLGAYWTFNAN